MPCADASAGLQYVTDARSGVSRRRVGRGFQYLRPDGRPQRDPETLRRIRALAIPPAWTEVWICCRPDGHLQATGRDARGRKQYLYHPRWREAREAMKYGRMIAFARALPRIRRRVKKDLALRGLPRTKVLAAVVRLLEATQVRVGNQEYARSNGSFGLTTMHNHHVDVHGATMHFQFRGKSGIEHDIDLHDPQLARIVRLCQELPGQELFGYVDDDGDVRDVTSSDVNEYIHMVAGEKFTAKDFRTWSGTSMALRALARAGGFRSRAEGVRKVNRAVDEVASRLGNTRTVCRKDYIHPGVIQAYLDHSIWPLLRKHLPRLPRQPADPCPSEDAAIVALLKELQGAADPSREGTPRRRAKRKRPRRRVTETLAGRNHD